jgi:hypothetical protein
MAEGDGIEKSSEAASDPPGASASVAASRSVFLSYASHDADVAKSICEYLERHGISCWMAPRDVRPGAQYADAIVRAINEAKAIVLVLSASAMASSHVAREVERVASKRKQIISFRIDGAPLTRRRRARAGARTARPDGEYWAEGYRFALQVIGVVISQAQLLHGSGNGRSPGG